MLVLRILKCDSMSRIDLELVDGSYTIQKKRDQEYLFRVFYESGKQRWEKVGNVRDLDPKDPNLVKARSVILGKKAKQIIELYLSGKIDKTKAMNEFKKLLDR